MSAVVRAIDVGFGITKFSTGSLDGRISVDHFPSLAFYAPTPPSRDTLRGHRRTVCVPVGKLWYEVGPDAALAADRFRATQLHDGYTETDEYRALTAGALHYMKQPVIDLLVVGLPVAQYVLRRAALEKAMTGTFETGRGRQVTVRKALVVAQPQGALFSYAAGSGRIAETLGQRSLVIDAGTRTFDWLVTQGMRAMPGLSHSVNRGVSDILRVIAEGIGADIGEPYGDHDAIDLALRTRKPLRIYQRPYDMRPHAVTAEKIAEQAVTSMLERLGSSHGFEHVVLAGGGAFLFRKALKARLPKMTCTEIDQPLYANVKGFQLLGEQYAREKELAAGAPAHEPALEPEPPPARVPVDGIDDAAAFEGETR